MTDPTGLTFEPFDVDDRTIRAALMEAHIPSLLAALVHLTGDPKLLTEVGPLNYELTDFFGDGQGGLTAEQQMRARELALEALVRYRDGGCKPLARIPDSSVHEIMQYFAAGEMPPHYLPFLIEELALDGGDSKARDWLKGIPEDLRESFHVVVIGAGMSGLTAAVRLSQVGLPFTVLEKNPDVGGTWFENSYPGCRVDTPNHLYSLSFEPNHDWPQFFSTRDVLLDYFRGVADRYDLRKSIRFETSVEAATWDDAAGRWRVRVRTSDGREETLSANLVISAVGQLNRPRFPDIAGRERFRGMSFHSAQWNHDCDLAGKRVAVIGTGASAFQFVPEIAPKTSELLVFQRTPPWLGPTLDYHLDVPEGAKWLLRYVPYYEKWYRFWLFWQMTDGILPAVTIDPEWDGGGRSVSAENEELREMLAAYIHMQVGEHPDLLEASVPDYPPGAKRMLRDNGVWLGALKRDDVHLITSPITEITETGLRTADGRIHEVDAIIYGTGFQASDFLQPMKITGRDGLDLNDHWGGDARAYLGMTIPDFPNLFLMYGPNTNIVVNGSIIFFSECEVRYILGCIELLLRGGHRSMSVKRGICDLYNRRVDEQNARMTWGISGVDSWYKNAKGRVSQNWPFALVDFWGITLVPEPGDYELS